MKIEVDGDRLSFDVRVLEGDLGGAEGPATVFIEGALTDRRLMKEGAASDDAVAISTADNRSQENCSAASSSLLG